MQISVSKVLTALAAIAALAITSCGGAAQNFVSQNEAPAPQAADDSLPGLSFDDHGQPGRSASALEVIAGSAAIQSVNGTVVDTTMQLAGSEGNMAWALYKVEGLSGRKVTSLNIEFLPEPSGQYGVGVSNFSEGVWDLVQAGSLPEFEYDLTDEMSRLTSNIGNLYFVVVCNLGNLTVLQSTVISRDLLPGEEERPVLGREIAVSEGLADKIVIQWEAVAGSTNYELWRMTEVAGADEQDELLATIAAIDGQASYVYEDTAIVLAQEYKYRIRGTSSAGAGAFSRWRSGWAGTAPLEQEAENELEITGLIESLDELSISVNGNIFEITPATIWLDDSRNVVTAAGFAVGANVEISGEASGAGVWKAVKVQLEDAGVVDEMSLLGAIDAIETGSITVSGQVFAVTEFTEWLDINNLPAVQADFAAGMMVEITGDADGIGGWNARTVKAEDQGAVEELTQLGTIEALDELSITVAGQAFAIIETTTWVDNLGLPLTQADFAVGMSVEVTGDADGLGGWNARTVKLEDQPGGEGEDAIELLGAIEAIDAVSITVQGTTFSYDASTEWLNLDKDAVGPEAFAVGMLVDVSGNPDGQGGWIASRVRMKD